MSAPPTQPVTLSCSPSQNTANNAPKAGSLLVSKPTRVGELWRSAQFWATNANTVQPATR